ncbi:MAG: ABC transporter ATP-binding protein [Proteobacteria bacterium]|nr:ABC transporter ATP-binding protein [Pseudomonadota bacterium]
MSAQDNRAETSDPADNRAETSDPADAPDTLASGPAPDQAVIWLDDLAKTYRAPFTGKRIEALRGISFAVGHGEVFGFLGPNGAGKTTSIRILMGLISATRGRAAIFGQPVPSRRARQRLGFLPEAPYFYEYLTATEMLDLTGRLFGMNRQACRKRAGELLERVGLEHARNIPLKRYSKGMLQRAGIAQALISDPDLVVLDEPLSGLDPAGRRDVLDIIRSLRDEDKTVFFSSHILTDVEHVSDRVAILASGRIRAIGALSELLDDRAQGVEVRLRLPDRAEPAEFGGSAIGAVEDNGEVVATLAPDDILEDYLARALEAGARVVSVIPRRQTLEELFIRCTRSDAEPGHGEVEVR